MTERDRLREHAARRVAAIPDTEGDVQAALWRLEDLLSLVATWQEEEPDRDGAGGSGLAVGPSREAVWRLGTAVRAAEAAAPAQPVAPDGRYELVPLAWAIVERADLIQLGLAAQALGRGWALRDELVADALAEMARDGARTPEDAVAEVARLQGLLALPWDDDVSQLARALPAHGGRVVLTSALHGAYERVVSRILGIWHAGDPLAPHLYRGR